jgi:pyridoxine kinase
MDRAAWLSGDEVDALDLPLARAAEKVLASMHEVLAKTAERMEGAVEKARRGVAAGVVADGVGSVDGAEAGAGAEAEKKKTHLLKSKAAELRLVRHLDSLRFPKVEFRATRL